MIQLLAPIFALLICYVGSFLLVADGVARYAEREGKQHLAIGLTGMVAFAGALFYLSERAI